MVDGIALISCSFPEAKVHDGKKKLFLVLHRCPVSSNDTEQYQMIPAIPAIPTIPTIPGDTCAGSQTCNHRNWKKRWVKTRGSAISAAGIIERASAGRLLAPDLALDERRTQSNRTRLSGSEIAQRVWHRAATCHRCRLSRNAGLAWSMLLLQKSDQERGRPTTC